MMSPAVRAELAENAAKYAKRNGYVPITVTHNMKNRQAQALKEGRSGPIKVPFLGNYVPKGYKRTGVVHFVDTSGFGSSGEPALTAEEFLSVLVPGKAYAMTEAGQFQAYVAEFTPPKVYFE